MEIQQTPNKINPRFQREDGAFHWERLPHENERFYSQFRAYLELPYSLGQTVFRRNMKDLMDQLGYAYDSRSDFYARKTEYDWDNRCLAYDDWMYLKSQERQQAQIADVRDAVVQQAMIRFDRANRMADAVMDKLELDIHKGDINTSDIKRMADMMKNIFETQAALLGVPLAVRVREGSDIKEDVFVIGAKRAKDEDDD